MNTESRDARVSIIVPSWTGEVGRLMESVRRQTFNDYEVEVVKGVSPAARARNIGVARTCGQILLFIDDDAFFGHRHVLQQLVDVLDSDPAIGAVGTSKLVPPGATRLRKMIGRQVPRMVYPVVPETVESNPPLHGYGFTAITTTCSAVRREAFEAVGGFDEELTTGPEDTDFFFRLRQKGYRIVVAGKSWVYHDPPGTVRDLLRKSFWYGVGHATEARKHPRRGMAVLPLDTWYGKLMLVGATLAFPLALFVHYYFDPTRRVVLGLRPLKTLSTYAVLAGYAYGWFGGETDARPITYMGRHGAAVGELSADTESEAELSGEQPLVSIIVPSWSGDTARLRASLETQTYSNYELEVVKGVSPAGRARNLGVQQTHGQILLFVDDDAYFGNPRVIETLVRTLQRRPDAGVAGPSKLVPEGASALQKAIGNQVPRMVYPVVPQTVESNPPLDGYGFSAITTTCCAVKRDVFEQAGGFDEDLTRSGEDTDFFYRVHRNGWRLLLAGNCWVYHDPPGRVRDLLRKSFWYGVGHASEAGKDPGRGMSLLPLDRWYGKLMLAGAVLGFPLALFVHYYFDPTRRLVFGFRPFKTLSTYAVLSGYVYGWYNKRPPEARRAYMGRPRAQGSEEASQSVATRS